MAVAPDYRHLLDLRHLPREGEDAVRPGPEGRYVLHAGRGRREAARVDHRRQSGDLERHGGHRAQDPGDPERGRSAYHPGRPPPC